MLHVYREPGRLLLILAVLGVVATARTAVAQAPDAVDENEIVAALPKFELISAQFDQMAFGGDSNGAGYRGKLEFSLSMLLDDIERACGLTVSQKQKLRLAGHGDMKHFQDMVEEKRSALQGKSYEQNKINEIHRQLIPLNTKLHSGLYGDGSLFSKTIRNTLNDEQYARYQQALQDRRSFRYQAKVDVMVANLGNALGLSSDQRQRLTSLLTEKIKPPKSMGTQDYYVFMFIMSRLPEDQLKPIFDDAQWACLKPSLMQWRGLEQHLIQNGYVPADSLEKQR